MTKHTPEPWISIGGGKTIGIVADLNDDDSIGSAVHIASVNHQPSIKLDGYANAQRITNSVNACAGIPTSSLSEGSVRELVEAAHDALHRMITCSEYQTLTEALAPFTKEGS